MEINNISFTGATMPTAPTTQTTQTTGASPKVESAVAKVPITQEMNRAVAKKPVEFAEKAVPAEDRKLSEDEFIATIEKANKEFIAFDRRFEFSIHDLTKQIMVKIIDANTNEVIRELPSEKVLDMVAARWKEVGIIVDKKV